MMGTAAGLDRNLCRCKFLKKRHHLLATKFLPKNRLLGSIDPVKLKKVFRGIHAYSANVFHGQFLLSEIYDALVQAQSMPWEPSTPTIDAGPDPDLPRFLPRRERATARFVQHPHQRRHDPRLAPVRGWESVRHQSFPKSVRNSYWLARRNLPGFHAGAGWRRCGFHLLPSFGGCRASGRRYVGGTFARRQCARI